MKKLLILLTVVFMIAGCGAVTKMGVNKTNMSKAFDPATVNRVAIVDFDKNVGIDYHTDIIADKFTAELVDSKIFALMDRNDIKKVMYEVGFQQKSSLSGILNDATLQRLSAMGADSILTGNLVTYIQNERNGFILNSEVHLIAKLIKIESGEVIWSSEMQKRSRSNKSADAELAEVMLSDLITKMSKPLKKESMLKKSLKFF